MDYGLSIRRRMSWATKFLMGDLDPRSEQGVQVAVHRNLEWVRCRHDKVYWFNTWVWTYNPKNVGTRTPTHLPMDLFPRQEEAIRWLEERSTRKEDGAFIKSRDIGFTWMAGGYALHRWIFEPGYKATFGSRKAEYVDRIGDPDSIFEKVRMLYRALPHWMLPSGMEDRSMLLINEENGAILRGEAGDDMGRGGRSTDYILDENAFMENQEAVDASTSANSDCRIFGSSVNGPGNLFARKCSDGTLRPDQIFRFHFTDDPRKDKVWETEMRGKLETHVFASEYDCDFAASVEGICIPAKWIESCKKLRNLVHYEPPRRGVVGGDVGAGGKGKSVAIARFGALVLPPQSWSDGDTINTANTMVDFCEASVLRDRRRDKHDCVITALHYDSVGVGKGVQDGLKRRSSRGLVKHGVNVGMPPTDMRWPDGLTSKEKFFNLKAEGWWKIRERAKNSHEHVMFLEGVSKDDGAQEHDLDSCLLLPTDREGPEATKLCSQLALVKWERAENGKIAIQSKKSLAKDGIPSPDHADALVLTEAGTNVVETWMRAFGSA